MVIVYPAWERQGCLWLLCPQQQLVHPTKTPALQNKVSKAQPLPQGTVPSSTSRN